MASIFHHFLQCPRYLQEKRILLAQMSYIGNQNRCCSTQELANFYTFHDKTWYIETFQFQLEEISIQSPPLKLKLIVVDCSFPNFFTIPNSFRKLFCWIWNRKCDINFYNLSSEDAFFEVLPFLILILFTFFIYKKKSFSFVFSFLL